MIQLFRVYHNDTILNKNQYYLLKKELYLRVLTHMMLGMIIALNSYTQ